jgi:hypothetical protein
LNATIARTNKILIAADLALSHRTETTVDSVAFKPFIWLHNPPHLRLAVFENGPDFPGFEVDVSLLHAAPPF